MIPGTSPLAKSLLVQWNGLLGDSLKNRRTHTCRHTFVSGCEKSMTGWPIGELRLVDVSSLDVEGNLAKRKPKGNQLY